MLTDRLEICIIELPIAEWRYMGMVEHNSAISSSYDDGYNSGKKDGYRLLIKKMLENGINIDTIKLCSGLSLAEIENLKKDLHLNKF